MMKRAVSGRPDPDLAKLHHIISIAACNTSMNAATHKAECRLQCQVKFAQCLVQRPLLSSTVLLLKGSIVSPL